MTDQARIQRLFSEVGLTDQQRAKLEEDLRVPAKIIGIGQTGVGKTELLRSIFNLQNVDPEESSDDVLARLQTGAVRSVTKTFHSFVLRNPDGFRVQLTDGPGLGESKETESKHLQMWMDEIPRHDLLYWVMDGSSRDIGHIQDNMKLILDSTNYRERLVVVLNKVDQILLPQEMELKGVVGWNMDFNLPSKALLKLIKERTDDIIEKLTTHVTIDRDQIVVCSARRRWNHGKVLDKFLEYLPEDVAIKASSNRQVKDSTELMSELGKRRTAEGL